MTGYISTSTCILILIFPAASNLLEHGASATYTILLLLGIASWVGQKQRPDFTRDEKIMMATFAGFFLVCLIFFLANRVIFTRIPLEWELEYEARFLGFIPIYYLLLYRAGIKDWALWYGLAAGAVTSMIYAMVQIHIMDQGGRVTGPYNPIFFGKLSIVYGFMCLAGLRYFYSRNLLLTALPVIAAIGGTYAAFASGSRGAIIATPFFMLLFLVQTGRFKKTWAWRFASVALFLVVSVSFYQLHGLSMNQRIQTGIKETVQFFTEKEGRPDGAAVRLKLWKEGWELFKKRPLTGIGKDQYLPHIRESVGKEFAHLHNMFIEYMVVYGILGLIAVILLFAVPLWIFLKAAKNHKANERVFDAAFACLNLICGFFIFALSSCLFNRNIFISVYIIMIAAVSASIKQNSRLTKVFR